MIEEQRLIHEERMKMEEDRKKQRRQEQNVILGKKNTRPKLSFSLKWYLVSNHVAVVKFSFASTHGDVPIVRNLIFIVQENGAEFLLYEAA